MVAKYEENQISPTNFFIIRSGDDINGRYKNGKSQMVYMNNENMEIDYCVYSMLRLKYARQIEMKELFMESFFDSVEKEKHVHAYRKIYFGVGNKEE